MSTVQTDPSVDALWERRWGWGGIAFVALVVAWFVVIVAVSRPGADASVEDVRSFFGPGGDSAWLFLSSSLLGLAGLVFLLFLGSLRTVLRRAEGGTGRLSAVAFAAGVVFTGLLFAKNSIDLGAAIAVEWQDLEIDPGVYQLLDGLWAGLLMHEGVALGVLIGATSVVALRTGVFPRWLGLTGVGLAILSVFSLLLFGAPLILDLLWLLAVGSLIQRGLAQQPMTSVPG